MGLISACEFLIADNGCPADYIYEALSSSAIESIWSISGNDSVWHSKHIDAQVWRLLIFISEHSTHNM